MQVSEQNYGEVFTRRWVVDTILDLVGYDSAKDLGDLVVVEPSVGSGAFMIPIVERLLASADRVGRDPLTLRDAVRGYDLLPGSVARTRGAVGELLRNARVPDPVAAELLDAWLSSADFLLKAQPPEADFVVGNPPYIRIEDLPEGVSNEYRRRWPTMRGRADIYVGFYERSLGLLKTGGRLGFICADRWMRNQYGAPLRDFVSHGFSVRDIWSMHQVDAFEEQVDAYPAITVLAREPQGHAVVADTSATFGAAGASVLASWSLSADGTATSGKGFGAFRMEGWFSGSDMWAAGSPALIALMEHLNERFLPLQDPETGTRVSIGVATGADKAYVVKTADVEPDRMLPLAVASDLQGGRFAWSGHYLVNPWSEDGGLVDLGDYPLLRAYYERQETLRARFVAKRNPGAWFRTIDKVTHSLVARPKLLIADMRMSANPVLEEGGTYPHHNLYYVTSDGWDLEVLGGLILSRVGQAFIEAYAVRMRGGTLRFQAQYLKKIRVPAPAAIDPVIAEDLRVAFRARDVDAATYAAGRAYGIDLVEYGLVEGELAGAGK